MMRESFSCPNLSNRKSGMALRSYVSQKLSNVCKVSIISFKSISPFAMIFSILMRE
jgi:hypothetical protein